MGRFLKWRHSRTVLQIPLLLISIIMIVQGLFGPTLAPKNLATVLAERAWSVGLRTNIAVASDIEVAIHAARGFAGITLIPTGKESEYLSFLPIEVLSPSVEILETLHRWGISKSRSRSRRRGRTMRAWWR